MLKLFYVLACYAACTASLVEGASAQTALQRRLDNAFKASRAVGKPEKQRPAPKKSSPLDKQAADLEAFYLRKMLEQAFPDGKDSDLYGGGQGNDFYRSMYIDDLAKSWSDRGGIGLRRRIVNEYTQGKASYGERTPGNARLLMERGR
ncbi:MAG: rod-binding protein [Rickettsiales bacterium]